MIVVMEPDASDAAIESVISFLVAAGFDVHRSSGQTRSILGVVGDVSANDVSVVSEFEAVAHVTRVSEPFRLASRRFKQRSTVVEGPWGSIGGERPWIAIEPIGLAGGTRKRSGADDEAKASAELPYRVAAGRPFDAAVTRSHLAFENVGSLVCLSMHPQPLQQDFPVRFVERGPSWGANAWIGAAERELERGSEKVVLLEAGGEYPIGASIAAAVRKAAPSIEVIGIDLPSAILSAEVRALTDEQIDSSDRERVQNGVARAELCVLAAPVSVIRSELPALLEAAPVVTDCGSTKRSICAAVAGS